MQLVKIADIFPKQKSLKNVPCANIQNYSVGCCGRTHFSNWKVFATCADSNNTDIFISCKCGIIELTHTRDNYNCQSSCTHQCTPQQEVNKEKHDTPLHNC